MPEFSACFPVPVIFIVFNRPCTTRLVFDRIAAIRPAKLLLVADGPRGDRPGEEELCREVRAIVSAADWPCEVLSNMSPTNLGCGERVITGLDWAFSLVTEAVILEDDCLPDPSFFLFCEQLLRKYRGDPRVACISGTNLVARHGNPAYSYYFSRLGSFWGWATWASCWQRYDRHLPSWPELRRSLALTEVFDRQKDVDCLTAIFDSMHQGSRLDVWDYQWLYTNLFASRMTIVPQRNLIRNIGVRRGCDPYFPRQTTIHAGAEGDRVSSPSSGRGAGLPQPRPAFSGPVYERMGVAYGTQDSPRIRQTAGWPDAGHASAPASRGGRPGELAQIRLCTPLALAAHRPVVCIPYRPGDPFKRFIAPRRGATTGHRSFPGRARKGLPSRPIAAALSSSSATTRSGV